MEFVLRREPTKVNCTAETNVVKVRVVGGGDETCSMAACIRLDVDHGAIIT